MSLKPVNLALVNESSLFRNVLKKYLLEQKDINVVLQTSDLSDLFKKLSDFALDVLLIDVPIHQQNVKDALEVIRDEYPGIKILVLSMNTDIGLISDLLDLGIHGYISKMDDPEELFQAILAVAEGKIYRNKLFTEALYWNKQSNTKIFTEAGISLSEREKRILQLLWEEKSNKEMADELFLSVRSIEKIRQDLKEKLNVRSTVGLLKHAIEKKIISIPARSYKVNGGGV